MDGIRNTAAKLLQTTATNIGSGVQAAGRGLGRIWTKINPMEASGSASKAMAAAKQLAETPVSKPFDVIPKQSNLGSGETPISKPFDVVPQRSNLGSEGTQKTLSEKKEALETSIKEANNKLSKFENDNWRNKSADYTDKHMQMSLEIADLNDQLADIKKEIRDNS